MKGRELFFFDWDGTLCSDRLWGSLRGGKTEIAKTIEDFFKTGGGGLLRAWMIGNATSEEVNHYLSEKAGYPFDLLWDTFVKDCRGMFFSPSLKERILKIKKQSDAVLITGNMDCFRRFTIPSLQLEKYFDQIIISSETGFFKDDNNGAVFKEEAKMRGIPMKHAVLVDDSEKCCKVFSEAGGIAIKTSGPEHTIKLLDSFYECAKLSRIYPVG